MIIVNININEDDTDDSDHSNDDNIDNNYNKEVDSDSDGNSEDDIKMNSFLSPPISVLYFFLSNAFWRNCMFLVAMPSLA